MKDVDVSSAGFETSLNNEAPDPNLYDVHWMIRLPIGLVVASVGLISALTMLLLLIGSLVGFGFSISGLAGFLFAVLCSLIGQVLGAFALVCEGVAVQCFLGRVAWIQTRIDRLFGKATLYMTIMIASGTLFGVLGAIIRLIF